MLGSMRSAFQLKYVRTHWEIRQDVFSPKFNRFIREEILEPGKQPAPALSPLTRHDGSSIDERTPEVEHRPTIALIVIVALMIYLSNGQAHPEVDCVAAPFTAWSMARHGDYDLKRYPELKRYVGTAIRELTDGRWVSMRPPGTAIAALPVVAPVAWLRGQPFSLSGMENLESWSRAFMLRCQPPCFFSNRQASDTRRGVVSTLLFAFGTCLYSVASQALWMHGPATFFLVLALDLLTRERHNILILTRERQVIQASQITGAT